MLCLYIEIKSFNRIFSVSRRKQKIYIFIGTRDSDSIVNSRTSKSDGLQLTANSSLLNTKTISTETYSYLFISTLFILLCEDPYNKSETATSKMLLSKKGLRLFEI